MDDMMIKAAARDFMFDEVLQRPTPRTLSAIVEAALRHGYELGKQDGQMNLEAACDASFDSGWQYGADKASLENAVERDAFFGEAYDTGYLQGVRDARANPALADDVVQDILAVRAEDHYERLAE
ncbi:hypothetical protein [Bradyrhizobium barranii]